MTLTGAPAIAFLLALVVAQTVAVMWVVNRLTRWAWDRHMDKLKAKYRERFGDDFDPEPWKAP